MPLVVLTGLPGSGKSGAAKTLQEAVPGSIIINSTVEKNSRAAILAAVERSLTKQTTVIVDSTNHIKGFRYQLYCLARAASTPHVVLYCATDEETCKRRFLHGPVIFQAMSDRYEEPNVNTKWDSPLFKVVDRIVPVEEIKELLLGTVRRGPSMATQQLISSGANTNTIDSTLQSICASILVAIRQGDQKTTILGRILNVSRWTPTQLQRFRCDFMHINRLRPITDPDRLRALFLDYLASQ